MRTRCATGLRYSPENLSQPSKPSALPAHRRSCPTRTRVPDSPGDSGAARRHHGHHATKPRSHQATKPRRRCAMTTAATVPGCPVDESFDPLSPEFLADPYAVMAKVMARLPLDGAPIFF